MVSLAIKSEQAHGSCGFGQVSRWLLAPWRCRCISSPHP